MSVPRIIFLVLTILGLVHPVFFDESWSLFGSLFEFNWNLMIIWLAFISFSWHECHLRKAYLPLVSMPVAAVFGLGAGLPLYLFLRSRPLD